ncbi:DHS-like NAD/FAD-binding domain-containing protein [Acephala macrosclerotiorum]|nr:DHS-like NAD/FAD-binding domain-containing protein [Acephala macrosclerotiorum]
MSSSELEERYRWGSEADINSFVRHLNKSKRVLALCGAELFAPSGIPTFKGSGALWRGYKGASLSDIETLKTNPGLVWKYFFNRRRLTLNTEPNEAHHALAAVAKKKEGFACLTQNIDGLSQRANHLKERLYELHGSLMYIKCLNTNCDYIDKGNSNELICAALARDSDEVENFALRRKLEEDEVVEKLSGLSLEGKEENAELDLEGRGEKKPEYEKKVSPLAAILESLAPTITEDMRKEVIPESELPHCPKCGSLLRLGVVMFGEALSQIINLDLIMVIGTMAEVRPASSFVQMAQQRGARVAWVNLDGGYTGDHDVRGMDWLFEGDVVEVLEVLLEGVVGGCVSQLSI